MLLRWAVLCAAVLASADAVQDLTTSRFSGVLQDSTMLVVNFHLPWCAHSKKFNPEFEKVEQLFAGKEVSFARIDADAEQDLANQHSSQELMPEVRVFLGGSTSNSVRYTGERNAEALQSFVTRLQLGLQQARTEAEYTKALNAAKQYKDVVIVTGLFSKEHAAERDTFLEVYYQLRSTHIFIAASDVVAKKLQKKTPLVLAFKQGLGEIEYTGNYNDIGEMKKFAEETAFPLFGQMQPGATFEAYAARGLPIAWVFVKKTLGAAEKALVEELAPAYEGKLSFVWIDGEEFAPMMEQLGLGTDVALPAFAIEDGSTHYALKAGGQFTKPIVKGFADKVVAGTQRATVRSEPAPATPTKKGLTTLVGSTAVDFLKTSPKVFLFLYASWCSHCQAAMAPYREVASKFAEESVKIAIMDATKNDVPQNLAGHVAGYPTILFVTGTGEIAEFRGARTVKGMTAFVAEQLGLQEKYADHDEL